MIDIPPHIRRLIIKVAAKERISYEEALNMVLFEGIKALADEKPQKTACE